jgi:two-component system, OmpR family, KDP operon response regulator KdpE
MTKAANTLLIIEEEAAIARLLKSFLSSAGWRILEARTKETGLQLTATHLPDIILLDLALPDGGILSFLTILRHWTSIPIILMGSRGQENVQVAGIEAGANDFLVKPFSPQELEARLRLALRHGEKQIIEQAPLYDYLGLRVDLIAHQIWVRNKEIHLSPQQFGLLAELIRHAGRVVTHRELAESVWDGKQVVSMRIA